MPRVTSIVWSAFLGVVILGTVSGCRVHVHGQHRHHQHHLHHSTRSKGDVVHKRTHSTSSPKTSVRHKRGHGHGTAVEYDLHDDMVLPPKTDHTVEYGFQDAMALPPHSPPGLTKKDGTLPGHAKKKEKKKRR